MKVYLAADHNGFALKQKVIEYLQSKNIAYEDDGDTVYDARDDFIEFASRATTKLLSSDDDDPRAILLCGSGQGMVMAANRVRGIRAGLGWSREAARGIRNDEDANAIAIPAQLYDADKQIVFDIIHDFLHTPFAGAARYIRRNKQLDSL